MPTVTEDRDAIRDMLARYIAMLDSDSLVAERWSAFYTDDGRFLQEGRDPIVGQAALTEFAATLTAGGMRRLTTDHIIEVDGDTATCEATVMIYVNGQLGAIGRATDVLRRVDGAWRIAQRSYVPDFQQMG
jgi:ketosteroid isomerase-like protein